MITFDSQTVRGALNRVTENINAKLSSIEENNFKGANVDKDNSEPKEWNYV